MSFFLTHTTSIQAHKRTLSCIFIIFQYRCSVFRAVCLQIVFYKLCFQHAECIRKRERGGGEREKGRGGEKERDGQKKWERATKSQTNLSLIHFIVCHSRNSFIFFFNSLVALSSFLPSIRVEARMSAALVIRLLLRALALMPAWTEGWESRSFLTFLTILIPSNSQKSIIFLLQQAATGFELAPFFQAPPDKT